MATQKNNRNKHIEVCRTFAILGAVFCHTLFFAEDLPQYARLFQFSVGRFGVPMFLFISGYLNVSESNIGVNFLKRRFARILPPFIFWSFLYAIYHIYHDGRWGKDLFLVGEGAHLWYVYAIIALYIFTPLLSSFFSNCDKKLFHFYLVMMFIPFLSDYYNLLFTGSLSDDHSFAYCFNFMGGYLFYYMLGYYCKRYPDSLLVCGYTRKGLQYLILFILLYTLLMYCGFTYLSFTPYQLTRYMTPTTCLYSVCIIYLLFNVNITNRFLSKIISELSNMSFGIYLIHMFFISWIKRYESTLFSFFHLSGWSLVFLNAVLFIMVILSSYLIVKLISKSRYSKYIIG